jgi:hypothetical protein
MKHRRRVGGLLIGVVVFLILVAAWVGALELGLPVGGLSRDQAISLARRQIASTTPASVRVAVPGPFVLFRGGATDAVSPGYRLVWSIMFSGTYDAASCGPAPLAGGTPHCPPPNHAATVVVDYFNGAFIMETIGP